MALSLLQNIFPLTLKQPAFIILVLLWLCTIGFYGGYTEGNPVVRNANYTIVHARAFVTHS